MREIIPGRLWLGNTGDVRNIEAIMRAGVLAVIDLAGEQMMPTLPRSLMYCRFPVLDGQQTSQTVLYSAIETLVSLLRKEIPTLVYCRAGMSRSPAVTAGAIAILQGGDPNERLRKIVLGHPHDVSPQLWQDVRNACAEMLEKKPT